MKSIVRTGLTILLSCMVLSACDSLKAPAVSINDIGDAYKLGARTGAELARMCAWQELERTASLGIAYKLPDDTRIVSCVARELKKFDAKVDAHL